MFSDNGGEPGSTGCPKRLVACRGWSAGLVKSRLKLYLPTTLLVSVSLPKKQQRPRAASSPERRGRGRQFGIA